MHTSGGELSDSARYSIGGRQPPPATCGGFTYEGVGGSKAKSPERTPPAPNRFFALPVGQNQFFEDINHGESEEARLTGREFFIGGYEIMSCAWWW